MDSKAPGATGPKLVLAASDGGEIPETDDVCEHCGAPTDGGVYGGVHFEDEDKDESLSDSDLAKGFALAIKKGG